MRMTSSPLLAVGIALFRIFLFTLILFFGSWVRWGLLFRFILSCRVIFICLYWWVILLRWFCLFEECLCLRPMSFTVWIGRKVLCDLWVDCSLDVTGHCINIIGDVKKKRSKGSKMKKKFKKKLDCEGEMGGCEKEGSKKEGCRHTDFPSGPPP